MQLKSPVSVQTLIAGCSAVLALQAVWILAAELTRPSMPFFPTNEHEAQAIAKHHSSAASAAWIGWPRGELWGDYAITANATLLGALGTRLGASDLGKGDGGVSGTAATLARTDPRAWLVLAMNIQSDPNDGRAWAQLEMSHSSLPHAAAHHSPSGSAALIDWPRDEFWADYAAIAIAAPSGASEYARVRSVPAIDKKASGVAETAATLAPTDARAWLVLAINTQPASEDGRALAQLKMSYYTSPYSNDLFPLRIQIAVQYLRELDEELSNFLEGELESVIRYKPSLKQSITPAYRTASPAGRRFLETALAKLDPNYLAELKSNFR